MVVQEASAEHAKALEAAQEQAAGSEKACKLAMQTSKELEVSHHGFLFSEAAASTGQTLLKTAATQT